MEDDIFHSCRQPFGEYIIKRYLLGRLDPETNQEITEQALSCLGCFHQVIIFSLDDLIDDPDTEFERFFKEKILAEV